MQLHSLYFIQILHMAYSYWSNTSSANIALFASLSHSPCSKSAPETSCVTKLQITATTEHNNSLTQCTVSKDLSHSSKKSTINIQYFCWRWYFLSRWLKTCQSSWTQLDLDVALLFKGCLSSTYKQVVTTLSGSTPLFPSEEYFQSSRCRQAGDRKRYFWLFFPL